jgi:hypothetical protein
MTTDPHKKKPPEKIVKPAWPQEPQEHQEDETRTHPDQDRHEPEQDHHEHGNLPKRPGRPGTT